MCVGVSTQTECFLEDELAEVKRGGLFGLSAGDFPQQAN